MKWKKELVDFMVNGRAALCVQDADSCQKLSAATEQIELFAAIQNGMIEIENGQSKSSEEFFREFFARYKIEE